ncbi:SDR family oxidoreductase [Micromonospora andamanensis]|uniref:NmrA family transcriptional regulator n=1 Tax=Micromonospora andamanensis TaxID=1287068 RepID=A0ABQ4I0Q5_9ACTN|nr:NAD(P)H-binding protein [Micromonospora andamanensis]GIJ11503.1 NmrA family transcriptional regulator [Micromonospora andamanensis]
MNDAPTNAPVLVTGGTGTLGRHVLPRLRAAGRQLRVLSRTIHPSADGVEYVLGDLLRDEGVAPALDGVHTVLHLAGGPKGDDRAAVNLMRTAARAGVRHLVHISVVGAGRVPIGYFEAKHGAERAVSESGVPWTTLRAAQFHDLVFTVVQKLGALPIVPDPKVIRFQPVDSRDVADRLVDLVQGAPSGLVPEIAGPRVYTMADLVRSYLAARGRRRPFLPVPVPGAAGRAYRDGDNLSVDGATVGTRSWEEFLAEKLR